MSSNGLVTVAIPTRHRPDYLRLAVESTTSQDYRPLEIVIGDDSTDDRTATVAEELRENAPAGCTIVYQHNVPPLGQAGNINALFHAASAPRLVLLHDDDLLLPGAISTLTKAMDAGPDVVAAYGFRGCATTTAPTSATPRPSRSTAATSAPPTASARRPTPPPPASCGSCPTTAT